MNAFARSYIAQAQELRAKTLRLDESRPATVQPVGQADDRAERKADVIAIWERCRDRHGISMHEFIRRWGHAYSTGHGYLDRDEKRYPKPRSVRTARALEECLGAEQRLRAQIDAAKGVKVASW